MSDKNEDRPIPKWGAGSLQASFRQGLSEIRGALYPDSTVAQPIENGMYGTTLPSEVQRQREADPDVSADRVSSIIDRVQKMANKEPQREDREPERE